MTNYVYICSSGHSGSTLLEMILASHPSLTVALGEVVNLNAQLQRGRVCSCGSLPIECPRWRSVRDALQERRGVDIFQDPWSFPVSLERPRNRREGLTRLWARICSYSAYVQPVPGIGKLAIGRDRLIRNTLLVAQIVREVSGRPVVIDSSKDYLRMRDLYEAAAPGEMKVIYLTRDGRGCLWSSLKRQLGSPSSFARQWLKNQRRTHAMLGSVPREDRIRVRYEDLCSDPVGTTQQICDFVGIDYDPVMLELRPPEHHSIAGNRIRVRRAMDIRLDTTWREKLTAAQLEAFESIAGVMNRRLGYGEPAVSPAVVAV